MPLARACYWSGVCWCWRRDLGHKAVAALAVLVSLLCTLLFYTFNTELPSCMEYAAIGGVLTN